MVRTRASNFVRFAGMNQPCQLLEAKPGTPLSAGQLRVGMFIFILHVSKKIIPLCPFAASQFRRHAEWADVLKQ